MTKSALYYKWNRNVNAEYIIPSLNSFFNRHTVIDNMNIPKYIYIDGVKYKLKKEK